jgi:integrase
MKRSKNGNPELPGAHKTASDLTRKGGAYYIRITAWRGAGAPVIGKYQGATRAEAEALALADAAQRAGRYAASFAHKADADTIAGVLEAFEQSAKFKGYAETTRAVWKSVMKSMRGSKLGELTISALKSDGATRALTRWRDKEAKARGDRAADMRMQILKRSLNWARGQGLVGANPALGIEEIYQGDRSDLIWEAEHVEAYVAEIAKQRAAAIDAGGANLAKTLHSLAVAEDALMLALFTGLRLADIAGLRRAEIRSGAIVLAPRKSARRARAAGKRPRVVVIPILPEIGPLIERRLGDGGDFVLTVSPTKAKPRGGCYTPGGLGQLVASVATAAGIERHLHDARGSFVTYARSRGLLTREEIADMLGWSEADVRDIERRYLSNEAVVSATLERMKRATEA